MNDNAHCGACGVACPDGTRCAAGSCEASCRAGQTACEGVCRDLQTDALRCGGCARACAAGEGVRGRRLHVRLRGAQHALRRRVPRRAQRPQPLRGVRDRVRGRAVLHRRGVHVRVRGADDLRGRLRRPPDRPRQLRRVRRALPGVSDLRGGRVRVPDRARGVLGLLRRRDLRLQQLRHLRTRCADGQFCRAGTCQADCGTLRACGGACVDVTSDNLNCGACARECGATERCTAGACVPVCAAPFTRCGARASTSRPTRTTAARAARRARGAA